MSIAGDSYFSALAIQLSRGSDDLWLGLGQAENWGGTTPPEDPSVFPNPIMYIKVTKADLVKQVESNGDYIYKEYTQSGTLVTLNFQIITEAECRDLALDPAQGPGRWIFIYADILSGMGSLETITYRAAGLFHNLVPATGHENDSILLNANISNKGNMMLVHHYGTAQVVEPETQHQIRFPLQIGG